jgi:hypothetical protein
MDDTMLMSRHQIRRLADQIVDAVIDSDDIDTADIPDLIAAMDLSDDEKDQIMSEVTKQIDDLTSDLDQLDNVTDNIAKEQEADISDVEDEVDEADFLADVAGSKDKPVTVSKESVTVGSDGEDAEKDAPHDEEYADMGNLFSTISALR